MRQTPRWEVALLVTIFAIVGVSVFAGLCYLPRVLLDDAPTRVVVVRALWLPSRLLAWALAVVVLTFFAGVLALSVRVPWLLLQAEPMDAEGHSFVWYRLALRPAESRLKGLLEDVARLGSTAIGGVLLAVVSYFFGASDRLELDLAAQRYSRVTQYLGVFTVQTWERPASDVLGASLDESVHTDSDGATTTIYHVTLHLADASSDRVSGPEEECRAAVSALQRLLASRTQPR
jgi:hypothetical protein